MQLLRIPRSLTAPDAWMAILVVAFLQWRQYVHRKREAEKGRIHAGARSKPKRIAVWSLVHECLFTNLRMFVSPFSSEASELNADMVDLHSESDLNSYAQKVASGKATMKKRKDSNSKKSMEVRSRRIIKGEMVHNACYPVVETTFNLALSIVVGLVSRWILGLIRSLQLSSAPMGFCCSPYRGVDDEGTRLAGSFERFLACVLVKHEGDNAGNLLFSLLLLVFLVAVLNLAWFVSSPSDGEDESNAEKGNAEGGQNGDNTRIRRIHPKKVKRFIVGVVATLSSLMLFHTPSLLRILGLDGLPEAVEEWGARIFLFGNLLGAFSLPNTNTLEEPPQGLQNLVNFLLVFLAIAWGYIGSGLITPIEETARNAAYVLSPFGSKRGKRSADPKEMLDLINVRMMILIQAMAPFIISCTYFFSARFAETAKPSHRSGDHVLSFSKHYFRNSGLFVRVALSWCFIGAAMYTLKPLVQSYLDQATTVASAMASLGEGVAKNDANVGKGPRNKRNAASKSQSPSKSDPFNDRYRNLVLTAGRVATFPALVLAILSIGHIRGGDGSSHPGIGHRSQPKDAPRMLLPVEGILPPYSDQYMSWIANQRKPKAEAGDAFLHVAALSQPSWGSTPFRDSVHEKVVNWFGKDKFCSPPETRRVKAAGRHVNYLLENDDVSGEDSLLMLNPVTGRELLDMAPPIPITVTSKLFRRAELLSEGRICDNSDAETDSGEEQSGNVQVAEVCRASDHDASKLQRPSFTELFSFLASHNFMTATVIFPIFDTIAFLMSVWWNFWYSITLLIYWAKFRGAASLQISA